MPANNFYLTKPFFWLKMITQDFNMTLGSYDGVEMCELTLTC